MRTHTCVTVGGCKGWRFLIPQELEHRLIRTVCPGRCWEVNFCLVHKQCVFVDNDPALHFIVLTSLLHKLYSSDYQKYNRTRTVPRKVWQSIARDTLNAVGKSVVKLCSFRPFFHITKFREISVSLSRYIYVISVGPSPYGLILFPALQPGI